MGKHAVSVDKPKESGQATDRKRSAFVLLIPILGFLVALSLLMYPVVATYVNNVGQQKAAQRYADLEKDAEPQQLAETIQRAHQHSKIRARGPILDPWLSRVSPDNVDYQAYLGELANFDAMGRLIVPPIELDLPIYHGTSEEVLHRGVGHLFGSDLPVGGPGTHSVLTAHTGLSTATLFDDLIHVKNGDSIFVQVAGEKLQYEVDRIDVVLPNETDSLESAFGEDRITLITCTPYGQNTHRLLVHGHRVPLESPDVFAQTHRSWPTWMIGFLIAALIGTALVAWWLIRQLKLRRALAAAAADKYETEGDQ